ncbi:NAD(P)/FAD-dependent oxidoreductase [Polynucleobacter asymbioticus]|uniref:Pyridine nucleotide-disulfide oxidoreductase n=1 Tax=Polynucleobacter asymbioticus TaxID=576611 RepID=A0AAC9NIB4_9BURK|nr:NAD(P)/FAD-dependent oxidoreductase [Polynucleobacter asymbioticus]APB98865.1 pyridine nucleotide-disulfide oxidoreductase [Polynucleobacter asymbioticus]APC01168.1 pyridine nucleotide-disulfide oxidoreductase [Polynucleobacter asymbioticus]
MGKVHKIVIVGGGAGGLELATKLGNRYGSVKPSSRKISVTLVDKNRTHIWKPKLHEVAAGIMDLADQELDYIAQAHWHHFAFRIGELIGIDREKKEIRIGPFLDDTGELVTPERLIPYDTLIIAIGSLTNDFGTPGVEKYAQRLESLADAKRFHLRMINACLRAQTQTSPLALNQLKVAIIGAGATGVELAAELHRTTRQVISYGMDRVDPDADIKVILIEAAPRILPALPERLSAAAQTLLVDLGVQVITNAKVEEVFADKLRLSDGMEIPAELIVWAAGVKAPDFLYEIGGLESNRANQLVVLPTLQTTRDPNIFAMGDCAACPWPEANNGRGGIVPPRAQAAHQQASHLFTQIENIINNAPLKPYRYRDFGSLVSLGKFSSVGSMMGGLIGGSLMIDGLFAKLMYVSLYKLHQLALHGWIKVFLDTISRLIHRRTDSIVKLH